MEFDVYGPGSRENLGELEPFFLESAASRPECDIEITVSIGQGPGICGLLALSAAAWCRLFKGCPTSRIRFRHGEFNKLLRHLWSQRAMGTNDGVARASALQLVCTIWPHSNLECASLRILGPISVAAWINHKQLHSVGVWGRVKSACMGWCGYDVGYRSHVTYPCYPIIWRKWVQKRVDEAKEIAEASGMDPEDQLDKLT